MSASSFQTVTIGSQSKLVINKVALSCVSGQLVLSTATFDVTDTETNPEGTVQPGRVRISGLCEGELTIQGMYAISENPQATPFAIAVGQRPSILLFPHGLSFDPFILASTLVDHVSFNVANPNQPNSWNFHCYSGAVTLPVN